jgi:hypothetical protein
MSLDKGLQKVMSEVPGCIACGYVDMVSGMNLGVKTVESHPAEVIELVAAATAEMFQGQTISMIERLFKKARGVKDDGSHFINEIIFTSGNLIHVMLRGKKHTEHALVVVCPTSTNLGMTLSKARLVLESVENSL